MSFLSLRNAASGLIGMATVAGATLPGAAVAQEGSPAAGPVVSADSSHFVPPQNSLATPYFVNLTETHVVPPSIVWQAFDRGVHTTPYPIRSKGFKDEHDYLAPISHPGYQFDVAVGAAKSVGIEADRPLDEAYDRLFFPYIAGMLLLAFAAFIIPEYSKKPLDIGNTALTDNLKGAAAFLLVAAFLHSFSYTTLELIHEGPELSDFRFNSPAYLASFLSMSLFSFFHLWSLAQKLTFRLPGPAMHHLFLRGRTRHDSFILTGERLLEATGATVRDLYARAQVKAETAARAAAIAAGEDKALAAENAKGRIEATIEAGHLLAPEVQAAIAKLPDDLKATVGMTLTSSDYNTFLADLKRWGKHVTVDVTTQELVTERHVSAGTAGKKIVIGSESKLKLTPDTKILVNEGKAVIRGDAGNQILVLKENLPVNGDAQYFVIEGSVTVTEPLPISTSRWRITRRYGNARFKVSINGEAKELLPAFGTSTARRPFAKSLTIKSGLARVFNLIPARVKRALRTLAPTTLTVTLDPPAASSPKVHDAIATILGPQRYVVRPVRPLIPINRVGLESVVLANQKQGNPHPTQVTLAVPRDIFHRHQDRFIGWLGVITGRETAGDYPDRVYVDVERDVLLKGLGADTSGGSSSHQGGHAWGQADGQKEFFGKLIRDRTILLAVPTRLVTPLDAAFLTGIEKDTIRRPAGDMTNRDEILYPRESRGLMAGAAEFGRIFGRAGALGFRFGRWRALGALTLTGGTISMPLTATMKMLTGYTDPATWIASGFRGYFSGLFNAIATPSWMTLFGRLRLNNFIAYIPGLIFISAFWETQNDLSHGEPPRMWWRNSVVDLSFEGRAAERARELALIQKEEAKISTEDRGFAMNMRLGNFVPTGYYTGNDLEVLTELYDALHNPATGALKPDQQAAQDRFLAGLMHDPGFSWMVHQDSQILTRFSGDIQANWNDIQSIYAERPDIDSQAMLNAWFNP